MKKRSELLVPLSVAALGFVAAIVGGIWLYSVDTKPATEVTTQKPVVQSVPQPTQPVATPTPKPAPLPQPKPQPVQSNWGSGHQAGYDWGEAHDICDTDYNNGNSESFNEGVRQWAEDNCDSGDDSYEDY